MSGNSLFYADADESTRPAGAEPTTNAPTNTAATNAVRPIRREGHAIAKRRREVRAARDKLAEQFEQLRGALPEPPAGYELNAKAHILEYTIIILEQLMQRATFLTVELAVASPDAIRRWVRACSDDGQKPLLQTVASVMKLFAVRKDWRYAEWWTLNEPNDVSGVNRNSDGSGGTRTDGDDDDMPDNMRRGRRSVSVMDNQGNVHGCVVRDSDSVMRLSWTFVHRESHSVKPNTLSAAEKDEERRIEQFARASQRFEFRPRKGMPGRVWTSRRAEWLVDLHDCEVFSRSRLVGEFGMETCLAVPIQFGGHVHSVMAFYSRQRRAYDPDSDDLACALSKSLEEVYSSVRNGPWVTGPDNLFAPR